MTSSTVSVETVQQESCSAGVSAFFWEKTVQSRAQHNAGVTM